MSICYFKDCVLGFEFSGRTHDGKRVMGLVENRGLATRVQVPSDLLWEIPNAWTMEDAATVPSVYLTVSITLKFVLRINDIFLKFPEKMGSNNDWRWVTYSSSYQAGSLLPLV